MAKSLTIQDFFKRFPDEEACLAHLFGLRYGVDYGCPRCGVIGEFKRLRQIPAYTCNCGHHVHPMRGTIFEKSHTPLVKWFYAIYLFTTTRHGVSAKELERQLGVSYPTAFRMAHLTRQHMGMTDGNPTLGGHVEADETYVGGKQKRGPRGRSRHADSNKTIVFGMVERGGDIITRVVPNASAAELNKHISRNVEPGSTISTDEWRGYKRLGKMGYEHGTVNHSEEQWKDGPHHTNTMEGYWSLLKRSILGTHVHVSKKHMSKYLGEFEFRYNLRHSPQVMFLRLVATL